MSKRVGPGSWVKVTGEFGSPDGCSNVIFITAAPVDGAPGVFRMSFSSDDPRMCRNFVGDIYLCRETIDRAMDKLMVVK